MFKEKNFDLHAVSLVRPHLLGLATLWVVLFHSYSLNFLASSWLGKLHLAGVLNRLKETGNCGVDVFLFLSGLGLSFSMCALRASGAPHPVRTFYARRFSRILPPVLIVSLLYYGFSGAGSLWEWLGKVFLFGSFLHVQDVIGYWYFALLILLYLCFPLMDLAHRKGGAAGIVCMILLSGILTAAVRHFFPVWFERLEIMLTRVPVFLMGMLIAPYCRGHARIPRWIPLLCLPLAAAGLFLIPRIPAHLLFLRRYAYAVWTVTLVLSDALLFGRPGRKRAPIYRSICLLGTYSMEMYLLYENLYTRNPFRFRSVDGVGAVYALTVFTAALALSVLLQTAVRELREAYGRPRQEAS